MLTIEKNLPIPPVIKGARSKGVSTKYGWHRMDVGDSVFIEGAKPDGKEIVSARAFGANNGMAFTARKVESGLRIWRIE